MSRGGRGRGRGQLSFNAEILGVGRGEVPTSALAPPPKYPPRPGRILPLVENTEQDYLLAIGKDFRLHMKSSPFYLKSMPETTGKEGKVAIERYSDRYDNAPEAALDLNWERFPQELRPEYRKKLAKKRKAKTASRIFKPKLKTRKDVSRTLEELEKKEKEEGDNADEDKEGKKEDSDEEEGKAEEGGVIESDNEEPDEEMDEGTDYANNYFDNGEKYLDEEDDNLDEGGIY